MAWIIVIGTLGFGLTLIGGIIANEDKNEETSICSVFIALGFIFVFAITAMCCEYFTESKELEPLKTEAIEKNYAEYVTIQTNKTDKPSYEWKWK